MVQADQLTTDFPITTAINGDEKLITRFCISDICNKRQVEGKGRPNRMDVIRVALL